MHTVASDRSMDTRADEDYNQFGAWGGSKVRAMGVEIIHGEHSVVRVSGEIDLSNVGEVKAAIDEVAARASGGFILDLSEVRYIDSQGVALVMANYQRLREAGGVLALVAQDPNVRGIFELVHSEELPGFVICESFAAGESTLAPGRAEGAREGTSL